MGVKWTAERRAKQAAVILKSKPWLKSTGPKTAQGKKIVSRNAHKRKGFTKDEILHNRECALQAKAAIANLLISVSDFSLSRKGKARFIAIVKYCAFMTEKEGKIKGGSKEFQAHIMAFKGKVPKMSPEEIAELMIMYNNKQIAA